MKFELIDPGVKIKYVPNDQDVEACYELGMKIAGKLPV